MRSERGFGGGGLRGLRLVVLGGSALAAWLIARAFTGAPDGPELGGRLAVEAVLGGEPAAGWARAREPRTLDFPADHGPHPEFRSEWWYVTGNLEVADGDARGRRFGFQVTLFRQGLDPDPAPRASAWAARDLWMAHFAVTDVATGRFLAEERFARGALGLAGARAEPFAVWLEGWRIEAAGPPRPDGALPLSLELAGREATLELVLEPVGPLVARGERGLSRKGPEPGNASHYYAIPRMAARGTVTVGGEAHAVAGLAWLDREWSTSALSPGVVGWDWLALHLDDGRDVMVYRLRRADGSVAPFSAGAVTEPDGSSRAFAVDAETLVAETRWESPRGGTYPGRWRVRVPAAELDLVVEPLVADQEWTGTVRYWEGAAAVSGRSRGASVEGSGYVELTGYADGAAGDAGRVSR